MDNKMSGWREACHDGMTKMNIYYFSKYIPVG